MPEPAPSQPPPSSPCRHLRHAGMLVRSDGQVRDMNQDYDNTVYWCQKTMKGFGPDDEMVEGETCRSTGRACYQPL